MVNNSIQHSKSKAKCTRKWAHCCQCQTNHINFYKSTSWKDINRIDPVLALANCVDAHCCYNNLNSPEARRIVGELDVLFNEHNELLEFFKSHMNELQSDNHANSDKTPAEEHVHRFNAPVVDDIAGILVGDQTATQEIVIQRRNNNMEVITNTHCSYDTLQYVLIFWKKQDRYCINIKRRDPATSL